jgi:hypothetical protein
MALGIIIVLFVVGLFCGLLILLLLLAGVNKKINKSADSIIAKMSASSLGKKAEDVLNSKYITMSIDTNLDKQVINELDNQMSNLEKQIKNMDAWFDKKVDNIILKNNQYFSWPEKNYIYKNIVINTNKDKVDVQDQKVQIPPQKIEIPKQPDVPSAKEPPKRVDLQRKVDLDVG